MATLLAGCGGQAAVGAPKFPVRGSVSVNGAPAEGVIVYMRAINAGLEGKDRSPVGVTDPAGCFELSTQGVNDGAPAGEYEVTFKWPYHPLMTNKDRLRGKFDSPQKDIPHVVVEQRPNELEPFNLSVPEAWLRVEAEATGR